MKKKAGIIILLLVVLGGLSWYALQLNDQQGGSDTRAFNFKIEDTTSITKIKITDAFGQQFTLVKKDNTWTDVKGACISQSNVSLILEINLFSKEKPRQKINYTRKYGIIVNYD